MVLQELLVYMPIPMFGGGYDNTNVSTADSCCADDDAGGVYDDISCGNAVVDGNTEPVDGMKISVLVIRMPLIMLISLVVMFMPLVV
ncbi:hypothetical protein DPMN_146079 [Dreissena polymorpha]|uniref:Uncharacterized protein n=1 Tax=Dreissena polymorpha TaxID=45954 RepID=A0A9D4F7Y6_DREPO|nr:hypothetical protein DPMN_146079 [Dreissena polymorpha]